MTKEKKGLRTHQRPSKTTSISNRPGLTQVSDDHEQSRLFVEKAREIGADEEKSDADEILGHLAKKPPKPQKIDD